MHTRRLLVTGAILAVAACSNNSDPYGGGGGGGSGPAANQVWMQNSAFNPTSRTIASGTQLSFQNKDGVIHNVTTSSVPAGVNPIVSGNVTPNATFNVTLTTAGTYQYFCSIHGTATTGMRGTITVN